MLFLDTAPHSDSAALEAARRSDLVLIPCRPAILDMEAISNTLRLVRTTKTPIAVVMNAIAAQGREADEAAEALTGFDVAVCPVHVVQRIAFSRSLITGLSAQESEPRGKAAAEASRLHDFVCAHLRA